RDATVTGVQTCALPILLHPELRQVERTGLVYRIRRINVLARAVVIAGGVLEDHLLRRSSGCAERHRCCEDDAETSHVRLLSVQIDQPFTPPAVRPETRYFCRYRKSRTTGIET